jgi:hypothetical protein
VHQAQAAEQPGLHHRQDLKVVRPRNTVRNRLARIEERLEAGLDDPQVRVSASTNRSLLALC